MLKLFMYLWYKKTLHLWVSRSCLKSQIQIRLNGLSYFKDGTQGLLLFNSTQGSFSPKWTGLKLKVLCSPTTTRAHVWSCKKILPFFFFFFFFFWVGGGGYNNMWQLELIIKSGVDKRHFYLKKKGKKKLPFVLIVQKALKKDSRTYYGGILLRANFCTIRILKGRGFYSVVKGKKESFHQTVFSFGGIHLFWGHSQSTD
jgi:hypothetical protein